MPITDMKIRVPVELKGWLEMRSIRNHRSMNKELIAILTALRQGEETDVPCEGFHRFASR